MQPAITRQALATGSGWSQHKNGIVQNIVRVVKVTLRQVRQLRKPFDLKPDWYQNVPHEARQLLLERLSRHSQVLLRLVVRRCMHKQISSDDQSKIGTDFLIYIYC